MGATNTTTAAAVADSAAFITRWQGVTASELATAQSFVIDLCDLLGLDKPHPTPDQDYMFERPLTFVHGDGSRSAGRIDCYKRGAFVLEAKKHKVGPSAAGFDQSLMRARSQGENYARALPPAEGRPPFVLVVDVGTVIEVYAEFSRSGGTYIPFPDPRSHRLLLADLARPDVRERLRAIWLAPDSLNPARISARVTRTVADLLAQLAKSLESAGHPPQKVAAFLTRSLFSMFAEDIGLLPKGDDGQGSFLGLLQQHRERPERLAGMLRALWQGMDVGGFNAALAQDVLKFNGKLFKGSGQDGYTLPLTTAQIDQLIRAAQANWREVEPAIFGTLLERALDPTERHALGAHYTPRAYVERLVLPTVIEPLRADWANAQAAALVLAREADTLAPGKKRDAKLDEARAEIRRFHHQLCTTRVLDPACGSGNFLYVTLEHLKRLEGEVINQLEALGQTQDKLALDGETVTLQQLRGIELNPRAAALAELVLWIGWLQWHVRTRGLASVAEPVVHDYGNIECRDAVLAYATPEPLLDSHGQPLTRWDGRTRKPHPVTGELVPDETAQEPQWRYPQPRPAAWPQAEFIVGNPPFIGAGAMRAALGDGYTQALRATWPAVPESADFVMYWWHQAALAVRAGTARQFGFITTNSLRQTFNRRVIESHLQADPPLGLAFAVPDHPWVDSAQGAAVRIAMSVARLGVTEGELHTVQHEAATSGDEVAVTLQHQSGHIHADLRIGANVAGVGPLLANLGVSSPGVKLHGAGFIVTPPEAASLGLGREPGLERHIRDYRNGRDLMAAQRGVYVIDLFGLSADEVRRRYPAVYQWVFERVKPERDQNNRATYRDNWWIFGEPRKDLRPALAGLPRYIATVETTKHRTFQFLDANILPDNMLTAIASPDALHLGVLSTPMHAEWAWANGGSLGMYIGNVRYNKTRCFETYPFPDDDTGLTPELRARIATLAEQIDAHRKTRQAAHEAVTLTGLYNVLDTLRREQTLSAKDQQLHQQGLVSVLRTLHDELDAAVLAAYGWSDLAPIPWADDAARQTWTATVLERLVALNTRRAAEEAQGHIRWLRPAYQNPAQAAQSAQVQTSLDMPSAPTATASPAPAAQPWPATLPEQIRALAQVLDTSPNPLTLQALATHFKGRGPWKKSLPTLLHTLEALGRAQVSTDKATGEMVWRGR
jgi:hypothetical protein